MLQRIPHIARVPFARYVVAVLVSALALLLTMLLEPLITPGVFPLFLAAVMVSAWFGGLGPGLVATVLSAAVTLYYFLIPQVYLLALDSFGTSVRLSTFVLAALVVTLLSAALRQARINLEARVAERTAELAQVNAALRTEIAERARVEEERQELIAHQQTALDRLAGVLRAVTEYSIIGTDVDGTITIYNEGAERMLGYSAAEVVGKLSPMVIHDQAEAPSRAAELGVEPGFDVFVGAARRGEAETREWTYVRKDGSRLMVLLTVTATRDDPGEIDGFIGIARDITRRKQAEKERADLLTRERKARAEAEAAQQRLAFLAEASATLASSLDYEATLESVGRLVLPFLADWCAIDLVERDNVIRRVAVVHADPKKEAIARELARSYPPYWDSPQLSSKVLRSGRSLILPEVSAEWQTAITRDADHLSVVRALGLESIMAVPLVARGATLGVITFGSARPDRHYGQLDLSLAEAIGRRAALAVENARLYREAQEAIHLRDGVLLSVSHDLRNPLTIIKLLSHLLEQTVEREKPDLVLVAEGLGRIGATATKMASLINELLDVARLKIGQQLVLDRCPIDLVALARQMATEHQQTASRHHIHVEAGVPQLIGVWDPARLERVLGNLLSNAIKYSPAGGDITIRIAREADVVGSWAILEVRDEGIGIRAADLPFLFEPFHRGANVTREVSGTGLGLAGARRIVEQHGGTIAVASEEGVGSTFTVRLPMTTSDNFDDLVVSASPKKNGNGA